MAESDVGICSDALVLLGVPGVSSFLDEPNGPTCGEIYNLTRDALLGEYPWRFVMQKSGQLGLLAAAPKSEWQRAFQLPSDLIGAGAFTLFQTDAVGAAVSKEWELFGRTIHTNYNKVFIDYRVRPDENQWPDFFSQLMTYEMAWKLAEPVTEDDDKMNAWFKVARGLSEEGGHGGYYRIATQTDAMGNTGQQIEEFTLLNARMGDR